MLHNSISVADVTTFHHISKTDSLELNVDPGPPNAGILSMTVLRADPGLMVIGINIGSNHGIVMVRTSSPALYVGSR
jgi:broad specificity polyphosphatase/5'/3'-nucleotidase SurE